MHEHKKKKVIGFSQTNTMQHTGSELHNVE